MFRDVGKITLHISLLIVLTSEEVMTLCSFVNFEMHPEWRLMFAGELRTTIRQEMENSRDCNDRQKIRYLLSEGRERLKRLDEMLDMQGHPE